MYSVILCIELKLTENYLKKWLGQYLELVLLSIKPKYLGKCKLSIFINKFRVLQNLNLFIYQTEYPSLLYCHLLLPVSKCFYDKWFAKKLLFVKDIFIHNKLFAAVPKELIIYKSDHLEQLAVKYSYELLERILHNRISLMTNIGLCV